jgi:hypothetical protein
MNHSSDTRYSARTTIDLPQHWSPEQAFAVWAFLDDIAHHIWLRYQLQIMQECRADTEALNTTQLDLFDPDDPLPF